jgi:hypothetical protein
MNAFREYLLIVFVLGAFTFSGQPGCNTDEHAYNYQTNTPKGTAQEGTFIPTDKTLKPPDKTVENAQTNAVDKTEER